MLGAGSESPCLNGEVGEGPRDKRKCVLVDVGRNRKIKPPICSGCGLCHRKVKEQEVMSPPCFIREFILPPKGTPHSLGAYAETL